MGLNGAPLFVLPPVIGLLVRNLDYSCHNSEALLSTTFKYTSYGNFVYVPEQQAHYGCLTVRKSCATPHQSMPRSYRPAVCMIVHRKLPFGGNALDADLSVTAP